MYALRDCFKAKEVWNKLLSNGDVVMFYGLSGRDWITWLLKTGVAGRSSSRWMERMIGVCWLQWRWRNSEVIEGTQLSLQQRLRQVIAWFEDDMAAYEGDGGQSMGLYGNMGQRSLN